jgi:hypothetical protein
MKKLIMLCLLLSLPNLASAQQTYGVALGGDRIRNVVEAGIGEVVNTLRVREIRVSVSSSFPDEVTQHIADIEVPSRSQAEEQLRRGVNTFLQNLAEFAQKLTNDRSVRFDKETLDKYLPQSGCGQLPCNRSKCCKDCSPQPCKL